jgi:hypothetical protein
MECSDQRKKMDQSDIKFTLCYFWPDSNKTHTGMNSSCRVSLYEKLK